MLRVIAELIRTNSRCYSAQLIKSLLLLPEETLARESTFAILLQKIPVETKDIRERLRILAACMEL